MVSEAVGENACVWQQQKLQTDSSSLEAQRLPVHLRAPTDEPGCFRLKLCKTWRRELLKAPQIL